LQLLCFNANGKGNKRQISTITSKVLSNSQIIKVIQEAPDTLLLKAGEKFITNGDLVIIYKSNSLLANKVDIDADCITKYVTYMLDELQNQPRTKLNKIKTIVENWNEPNIENEHKKLYKLEEVINTLKQKKKLAKAMLTKEKIMMTLDQLREQNEVMQLLKDFTRNFASRQEKLLPIIEKLLPIIEKLKKIKKNMGNELPDLLQTVLQILEEVKHFPIKMIQLEGCLRTTFSKRIMLVKFSIKSTSNFFYLANVQAINNKRELGRLSDADKEILLKYMFKYFQEIIGTFIICGNFNIELDSIRDSILPFKPVMYETGRRKRIIDYFVCKDEILQTLKVKCERLEVETSVMGHDPLFANFALIFEEFDEKWAETKFSYDFIDPKCLVSNPNEAYYYDDANA